MKRLILIVIGLYTITLCGCLLAVLVAGAAIGVGTYAYIKGELQREYYTSYDKVWDASLKAIRDLEMRMDNSTRDALKGEIYARRADSTNIKVIVEKTGENATKVSIRVGVFGDEGVSRTIHDQIAKNLGVK